MHGPQCASRREIMPPPPCDCGAVKRPIRQLSYEERIQALEELIETQKTLIADLQAFYGSLLRDSKDHDLKIRKLQDNEARRAVSMGTTSMGAPVGIATTGIPANALGEVTITSFELFNEKGESIGKSRIK